MLQRQNLIAIMMILSARPSQVKLQGSITGTSLHWEFNLQSNVGVNLRVNKSDQPRGANAGQIGACRPSDTAARSPGPRSGTARSLFGVPWLTLWSKGKAAGRGHRQTGSMKKNGMAHNQSIANCCVQVKCPRADSMFYPTPRQITKGERPRRNYQSKVTQCAERRWRTIWLKDIRLSLHTQTLTNTWPFPKTPCPAKRVASGGMIRGMFREVCFGGMFRGMFRPPLLKSWVWFVVWFAGMIRGHDSGYDSRKCNMHVIINFVYAISGNTHMCNCICAKSTDRILPYYG